MAAYFSDCARARSNNSRQRTQTASTPPGALAATSLLSSSGSCSNGANPSRASREQTGHAGAAAVTSERCAEASTGIISDTINPPLEFFAYDAGDPSLTQGRAEL